MPITMAAPMQAPRLSHKIHIVGKTHTQEGTNSAHEAAVLRRKEGKKEKKERKRKVWGLKEGTFLLIFFCFWQAELVKLQPSSPPTDQPIMFVCGAFAHGKIAADYLDEEIAISEYPLSGSVVCGKLCCAFEQLYGIM